MSEVKGIDLTHRSAIIRTTRHRNFPRLSELLIGLLLLLPTAGWASQSAIDPFVGVYEGISVKDPAGVLTARDIGVRIRRMDDDFVVDWHSVITDADGVRRRNHEVHFQPNPRHVGEHRQNVYREVLRRNFSGSSRPADPMQGESYFWSRIDGDTLTIYRMQIHEDGSQDLQIYRFTRAGERMHLEFKHMNDDRLLQSVTGVLVKQPKAP